MKSLFWIATAAFSTAACGAPRAETIAGDISTVLEAGVADGSDRFDHSAWDELVQKHAKDGGRRFDYAGLKKDRSKFEAYLESLATVDLSRLNANELQALFANAYNAYTIQTILEHVTDDGVYEIESIRDIDDVFGREVHRVGGFTLSLDNMEHNVLRPMFKDPRFHFAVNCASISCPPLPTRAFTGSGLDEELTRATESGLQNPDYVSVDGDKLVLTKILEWYGGDFVNPSYKNSKATLAEYVAGFATGEVKAFIEAHDGDVPIEFTDYDWGLNRP